MTDDAERWEQTLGNYHRLMIGWAEFGPADGDESFHSGTVLLVALAGDETHFDRQAQEAVEDAGYEFIATERVQWLTDYADVNVEVFPVAAEAVRTGAAASGVFYVALAEDDPEEHESETAAWADVRASGELVEVRTFGVNVRGVLLDFSDSLVLLQHVDTTMALLDGYCLFPRSEVLRIEPVPPTFVSKALDLRSDLPRPIHAPLDSIREFLLWATIEAPLLSIYEGRDAPGVRYVGAISTVGDDALEVRGVNRDGAWSEDQWEHEYADITRIDFLDNYLTALSSVLDPDGWPW